jgi:hypothetical protein
VSDKPIGEIAMLAAALLWARNHLNLIACDPSKVETAVLDHVVERIDKVLEGREPTLEHMRRFREFYSQEDSTSE